jgi:hypothetical protein
MPTNPHSLWAKEEALPRSGEWNQSCKKKAQDAEPDGVESVTEPCWVLELPLFGARPNRVTSAGKTGYFALTS